MTTFEKLVLRALSIIIRRLGEAPLDEVKPGLLSQDIEQFLEECDLEVN